MNFYHGWMWLYEVFLDIDLKLFMEIRGSYYISKYVQVNFALRYFMKNMLYDRGHKSFSFSNYPSRKAT